MRDGGILITNSVVWAASAEIAPTEQGAQVSAVQNCAGNAAGLLAPIFVGVLLQYTGSWMAPMVAAAVIALVGAAVYTLMLTDDARLSPGLGSASPAPGRHNGRDPRRITSAGGARGSQAAGPPGGVVSYQRPLMLTGRHGHLSVMACAGTPSTPLANVWERRGCRPSSA